MTTRVFKRREDLFWWHWRAECNMFQAVPMWKRLGKTIVYLELDGTRPTTFSLCPGCMALDARIRTKDFPFAAAPVTTIRQVAQVAYNPWGM